MSNDGVVATNVRRYELRLERDRAEKSRVARVVELFNCEMWDPLPLNHLLATKSSCHEIFLPSSLERQEDSGRKIDDKKI